jgi:hypothetical protein
MYRSSSRGGLNRSSSNRISSSTAGQYRVGSAVPGVKPPHVIMVGSRAIIGVAAGVAYTGVVVVVVVVGLTAGLQGSAGLDLQYQALNLLM